MPALPAIAQPSISLQPTSGVAGSQVTATISDGTPGADYVILFGPDQVASGVVGATGNAVATFMVPADASPQVYTVAFCQLTGGGGACPTASTPTAQFEVTTPPPATTTTTSSTTTTSLVESQPPIATDDNAATEAGSPVTIPVLTNDTAGDEPLDPSSVTIVLAPARGIAEPQRDGSIVYQPEPGYVGVDRFNYEVCDPSAACDSATVTVEVAACPIDSSLVESFVVTPQSGHPGDSVTLELQFDAPRLDACFTGVPTVRFTFGDDPLGDPGEVADDGTVDVISEISADAEDGVHQIVALLGEPPEPVAETPFVVDEEEGIPPWAIWGAIAVVGLTAGTILGRRWGKRSAIAGAGGLASASSGVDEVKVRGWDPEAKGTVEGGAAPDPDQPVITGSVPNPPGDSGGVDGPSSESDTAE